MFAIMLCSSVAPHTAVTVKAEMVKQYYISIDDTVYNITSEQAMRLKELQDDNDVFIAYIEEILNIELPAGSFTVRVYSQNVSTAQPTPTPENSSINQPLNNDFEIVNGVLYSYNGTATHVTIPNTVTRIAQGAFYGNSTVKKVIVPSSVVTISKYAFFNCSALRVIVFNKNNKTLAKPIIYNCSKLLNVVAPKGSKAYSYASENNIVVTTTEKITFANKTRYLIVGDSETNKLLNNFSGVKWKTSKKSVVSVSSSGKIKAKKKGKATITATANGKKYKYKVVVYKKGISNRVKQVKKSCIKSSMTKYQKVKAVHDWMVRNVKYDYYRLQINRIPRVSHTAKGALVKKVAVCDGYAYAFQKIMKSLKISCKVVIGSSDGVGHAWNMVKLGGKWYHIDVTFDDPIVNGSNANKTPYYNYFLKSSSTMSKSHTWRKSQYPKCTSKKYE